MIARQPATVTTQILPARVGASNLVLQISGHHRSAAGRSLVLSLVTSAVDSSERSLAILRSAPAPAPLQVVVEPPRALANGPGRHTRNDREWLDIASDDSPRRHDCPLPDGHATENRRPGGDPDAIAHSDRRIAVSKVVAGLDVVSARDHQREAGDVDVTADSDAATGIEQAVAPDRRPAADRKLARIVHLGVEHDQRPRRILDPYPGSRVQAHSRANERHAVDCMVEDIVQIGQLVAPHRGILAR